MVKLGKEWREESERANERQTEKEGGGGGESEADE